MIFITLTCQIDYMVYVALGLNHKTAPLDVREQFAALPSNKDHFLLDLVHCRGVSEAAVLSTCNRTELYCEVEHPEILPDWLAKRHHFSTADLQPFLYLHQNTQAIRHALRVASGLDSMMIGEPQILGQMKQAYQHACQIGTIKQALRHKFEYIFSASKRIRHQSGIGSNPVSIAYAAVQLVTQAFRHLKDIRVLLIGSGETSQLVAKYLSEKGVTAFMVTSRTTDNAMKLAQTVNAKTIPIGDIPTHLHQADIVVTATACPLPFINVSLVNQALAQRNHRPMFFLDLAVPRDIEQNVSTLANTTLYNIDDLKNIIEDGMEARKNNALAAEQMIDMEVEQFICWHRSLRASDMIVDYRQLMNEQADIELKRALTQLAAGKEASQVLEHFKHRLVQKLAHQPTIGLRQAAWDGRSELLDLAQYLFNPKTKSKPHEKIT